MRIRSLRPQVAFAAVLALVGIAFSAPVLLDDLVLRSGYLFRSSDEALEITQPVALTDQPRISLTSGTVSIPASFSRRPRAGEALAALLKGGSVKLELANPVFEIDLANPGGDDDAKPGSTAGPASPMLAAIGDATFERLVIKDGTMRLAFKTRPQAVLEDLNAEIIVKRKTALRFKGQFRYRGEIVSFDATLGSRLERRGTSRVPIKAQIWADDISASLEGRLDWRDGPVLSSPTTDISIPNVRALARWLGPAWPSGTGLKDFDASGALEWSNGVLSMRRGTFQLDGNEANGALQADFNGGRPALTGTLAASTLDLSGYLDDTESNPEGGGALLARLRTVQQVMPPLLGFLDADVRLSGDKVTFAGLTAERLAAGFSLKDARLLIDVSSVALPANGQAHGEAIIDGRQTPPAYELRGAAEGVDMAALSTVITGSALASGSSSLSANLKASGLTGLDILSRLDGEIGVLLPKGSSVACSVTSIAAAARTPSSANADPCGVSTAIGPTSLTAKLSQGVVTLPETTGGSGPDAARISGTADLVTKIIDLKIERIPAEPDAAAAEPPITVRGRPDALKINVPAKSAD